ncbi:MAG: hypothetical protein OEL88_09040 [Sterolibacteriaceae bacterium MAG5]|nr:hypothetical protein [Candidatus Nitricoxidireducens bremensis]
MANLNDCPCIHCIGDEKRMTEEFRDAEVFRERIVDLSEKGVTFNSCECGSGIFLICYRALACATGMLPRYEGQAIDGP